MYAPTNHDHNSNNNSYSLVTETTARTHAFLTANTLLLFLADPNCYDRSKGCTADAEKGLCKSQRNFMERHCPHSCDVCRIGTLTAIGFTDIKTIINPDFGELWIGLSQG